jgi:asparagine synthase (glutamine-hydrolysing)
MRSADRRFIASYNGELYNYKELRARLESTGTVFKTSSDTEVLIEALARWGEDALPMLRGMFAFAAYQVSERRLMLVRDALGIKPLYYTAVNPNDRHQLVAFASEIEALRPLVRPTLDKDAVTDLLLWGSISAPRTYIRQIRSLRAGHLATIQDGKIEVRRWSEPINWSGEDLSDVSGERMLAEIQESVRVHLASDVPVAVFLSSGVDSSVVASIASTFHAELHAITLRDPTSDEAGAASEISRRIGLEHTVVDLSDDEAVGSALKAIDALDQPSVDGVNSFIIAQAAKATGFKVALSGVGGDELFGGYRSAVTYRALTQIGRKLSVIGQNVRHAAPSSAAAWSRQRRIGQLRWVATYSRLRNGPYLVRRGLFAPAEVATMLGITHLEVLAVARERLQHVMLPSDHENYPTAAEAQLYLRDQLLRDTDVASMASSVEVRTPLVDAQLFLAAANCPASLRLAGPAKRMLRAAAHHELDDILLAPKKGFSVPLGAWIRNGKIELSDDARAIADPGLVTASLSRARDGREHWSRAWTLHILGHYISRIGD